MTLNEREAFWTEQLPIFKENYICLAQLDVLYFDNESGNFEIKEAALVDFEKEDFLESYHSVNTGWAMWLRAQSLEKAKAQAVPEIRTPSVTLTCAELKKAFDFGAPDGEKDQFQMETEMTIKWFEDGYDGAGYYCWYADLPEEGCIKLGESESGAEG